MRKVKFRGKPVDLIDFDALPEWHKWTKDGWVYGYLIGKDIIVGEVVDFDEEWFTPEFWCRVDPATVGQFTGLHDGRRGQGQEIYPGDIVKEEDRGFIYICKWNRHRCEFAWFLKDGSYIGSIGDMRIGLKVIGNIHDNPELMRS